MKICVKCNQDKDINQFALKKNSSGSISIRSTCRRCILDKHKERYKTESLEAREARVSKQNKWRSENNDKVKALKAKYRLNAKTIKLSSIPHDAHVKCREDYIKKFILIKFDGHIREWNKQFALKARWKIKHDINYLTNMRMRGAIYKALKGNKHGREWESIVGYSLSELIDHFNKTMPKGYVMSDAFNGSLHIDHIVPKSLYDMSKEEEVKKAWCISNLRLIPAKENLSKGNRSIYLV